MITADQLKDIQERTEALHRYLDIDKKRIEFEEEQLRTQAPDFWDDPSRAQVHFLERKVMNTRVFKDISKYQHRAWLGFTTRQIIFVIPAFIVTIIVLGLNLFFWQFGDWFVYGFVFAFTIPLLLFGVYKPNDLYFEHYLKYRLHFELTVPLRTITGKKGLEHEKKIKYIKETKNFND